MHAVNLGQKLDPWHLGRFEGQSVDKVKDKMEYYLYNPDEIVPGQGYHAPGESFNQFKDRFLSCFIPLLKSSKNKKIGIVCNYRTLTLAKAWIMAGGKGNEIVYSAMFDPAKTGEILYIDPDFPHNYEEIRAEDAPGLMAWKTATHTKLKNGLYMIRHGETAWNETAFSSNGNNSKPPAGS